MSELAGSCLGRTARTGLRRFWAAFCGHSASPPLAWELAWCESHQRGYDDGDKKPSTDMQSVEGKVLTLIVFDRA